MKSAIEVVIFQTERLNPRSSELPCIPQWAGSLSAQSSIALERQSVSLASIYTVSWRWHPLSHCKPPQRPGNSRTQSSPHFLPQPSSFLTVYRICVFDLFVLVFLLHFYLHFIQLQQTKTTKTKTQVLYLKIFLLFY